nr:uncharacterized protein LOC115260614 [Aedes albopictus]
MLETRTTHACSHSRTQPQQGVLNIHRNAPGIDASERQQRQRHHQHHYRLIRIKNNQTPPTDGRKGERGVVCTSQLKEPFVVDVAKDGVTLVGEYEGVVRGITKQGVRFEMQHVVCLPELRSNLLSVKKLSKAGIDVLFTRQNGTEKAVMKHDGDVIAVAQLRRNLYELELDLETVDKSANMSAAEKVFIARDVKFNEQCLPFRDQDDVKKNVPLVIPLRYQQEGEHEDDAAVHLTWTWMDAVEDELALLESNEVWKLVKRPASIKPLRSKWVFRLKEDEHGNAIKCKARLVVKGYLQKPGMDYQETYAPVAKLTTIRTVLAVGVQRRCFFHQMDVKTAFLHGDLREKIYMEVPDGVQAPSGMVCRLQKSLYGLKQSPRCWNDKFNDVLLKLGFVRSKHDYCLYTWFSEDGNDAIFLVLYVDDLHVAVAPTKFIPIDCAWRGGGGGRSAANGPASHVSSGSMME